MVVEPKYYNMNGIWALKPYYYLGPWTLREGLRGEVLPGPQKVCKMMAFRAVIMCLGLLFYILLRV